MCRTAFLALLLCLVPAQARRRSVPTPSATLPTQWSLPPVEGGSLSEWWKQFADADLTWLIERSLAANKDVALAQARLVESRASAKSAKAALLPTATPGLSYTDSQRSNNSPAIPRLTGAAPGASGSGADLIPRRYSVYQLSFDSSYEFDLFGGQRKSLNAARADSAAQQEDLRDTLISLVAEVAKNFLDLREAQARLALAEDTLGSYRQSLDLTRQRIAAGLQTGADELRLQAQLASAQSSLPGLEAKQEQAIYALAQLSGESNAVLRQRLETPRGLPALPDNIPAGIPSDLLRRRPDIRKASAQLDAATARFDSARTDWFPKIKLTSSFGGQSGELTNLLAGGSILTSLAPQISWGALNWVKTKASIEQQRARQQQQLSTLDKTILSAFRDVETSLSTLAREKERQAHLARSLRSQEQQSDVARSLYQAGLSNYLPVLEAERNQINALDQELQSRATVRRALVSLYKALGGGWESLPMANP